MPSSSQAHDRIFDRVTANMTAEEIMAKLALGGDVLECLERPGSARDRAEELIASVPPAQFEAKLDQALHTPIGETVRTTARPIQYCSKCGERVECMLCSKCKTALYCTKHCQKADWPAHKRFCQRTIPKKAVHENKILVLGSRAMYIPLIQQTLVYLVFRKLALDRRSAPWPSSPADAVVRLTWDLVPVCSPAAFHAAAAAAPRSAPDDDDDDDDDGGGPLLSMVQLVSVDVVPRRVLPAYIRTALASPGRAAAMHTAPGPDDLRVDLVCLAAPRAQCARPKIHENYFLYTPAMAGCLRALGEACAHAGSPFVTPRGDVAGLTGEEIMIRTINEAIVLDTGNEWRLRTRPREEVEG